MPRFALLPAGLFLCSVALAQSAAPVEVGVRPSREVALLDRGTVLASIVWGLAFSTVLTLCAIPVPYRFFIREQTGGRADRASG